VGDIDSAGHHHGLFSPEYEQAVTQILAQLEQGLHQKLKSSHRNAAILVTADHGMTEIDPKSTIYLNKKFPELLPMLKKNRQGMLIVPAGSCRDFFLHVEENRLEEAYELLRTALQDSAWVVKTSQLIAEGFFGQKSPSKEFLGRVGNLVILPYGHESIWWYEKHRFEQKFLAMHGGLTRAEMETILLFASLK
jgi:predicted AlkP superfamily pyrophosphatase or phosphodiesterase